MTLAAVQAAKKRHQQTQQRLHAASITLAGVVYPVAAIERVGTIEDGKGGFKQGRTAKITAPVESIAESVLFDASTKVLKRQQLTLNGITYRIQRASLDSFKQRWIIEASEGVA